MEKGSLNYQLDELCTRIALAEQEIAITVTTTDNYLRMMRELNQMRIKRYALEERIRRINTRYKPRVYLPDIEIMR